MKTKCLYLVLASTLAISYTNGADETEHQNKGGKAGRSMLRASQMTDDIDDGDETNSAAPKIPPLATTPIAIPSPKGSSPKGRSPKVRYNHDSFSAALPKNPSGN